MYASIGTYVRGTRADAGSAEQTRTPDVRAGSQKRAAGYPAAWHTDHGAGGDLPARAALGACE